MEMIIISWLLLAFVIAAVAANKGKSGALWFFLSVLLSPLVAGFCLVITLMPSQGHESNSTGGVTRKCPFCAEIIKAEALKCKHCGSSVEPIDFETIRKGYKEKEEQEWAEYKKNSIFHINKETQIAEKSLPPNVTQENILPLSSCDSCGTSLDMDSLPTDEYYKCPNCSENLYISFNNGSNQINNSDDIINSYDSTVLTGIKSETKKTLADAIRYGFKLIKESKSCMYCSETMPLQALLCKSCNRSVTLSYNDKSISQRAEKYVKWYHAKNPK